MKDTLLNEDAKKDWMNLVKKHKKKQKGLSPFVNTNYGIDEVNRGYFNSGNSPVEGIPNNPISGPHGADVSAPADVSCTGMGESLDSEVSREKLVETINASETVTIPYDDIVVSVAVKEVPLHFDKQLGTYVDTDYEYADRQISWDYEESKDIVFDFLYNDDNIRSDLNADSMTDDELEKFIEDNFYELLDKYMEEIKEHFYDRASEDAQRRYEYDPYDDMPEYDPYDESLDDEFDMSMRTLL